jgi:uncharacterized protein (DUF885 family)
MQVNRYINRPAQATSYSVGYNMIANVRKKREKALRGGFMHTFHLFNLQKN